MAAEQRGRGEKLDNKKKNEERTVIRKESEAVKKRERHLEDFCVLLIHHKSACAAVIDPDCRLILKLSTFLRHRLAQCVLRSYWRRRTRKYFTAVLLK